MTETQKPTTEGREQSPSIAPTTPSETRESTMSSSETRALATSSDFGPTLPGISEPTGLDSESQSTQPALDAGNALKSSKNSVLYDAGSTFSCALAATLKCVKAVAGMPGHSDAAILAKDLLSLAPLSEGHNASGAVTSEEVPKPPEAIIILNGNAWSKEFYANLQTQGVIIALVDKIVPYTPDRNIPLNVICLDPLMFEKLAPCKNEISAFSIFMHLLRSEFPWLFKDHVEEAQYFKLALCASIHSTLEAWTFVSAIIADWQRVMEPDNLVLYGRFIANVGPKIAKKRLADHSALISLRPDLPKIRVAECPDFADVTRKSALEAGDAIVVTYSLSADTTQCRLFCQVKEGTKTTPASPSAEPKPPDDKPCMKSDPEDMPGGLAEPSKPSEPIPAPAANVGAREVLSLITKLADVLPASETEPLTGEITCSATDFFALVRASIVHPSDEATPEARAIIAEGEAVLKSVLRSAQGARPEDLRPEGARPEDSRPSSSGTP